MLRLALLSLFAWGSSSIAYAFGFTVGSAIQCGDLSISWEGGTPPFTLLITPPFGTPQNISIPPSAFNNGEGLYTFQLAHLNQSNPFLLTMSDATSFNAGGTSSLIVTGPPAGQNCDTEGLTTKFFFQTPSTLQQCRPFIFTGYTAAQLPITVYGLIPGGQAFTFTIPIGSTQYQWPARLNAGTSVIFVMVDSTGGGGGATDILIVGRSDDYTCLVGSVPSTTIVLDPTIVPSSPSSSHSNTPLPVNSAPVKSTSGHSTAAIAGGVIGMLVLVAVIVAGVVFCLRQRRIARTTTNTGLYDGNRRSRASQRIHSDFDLVADKTDPFTGRSADGRFRNEHRTDLPPGHEIDPFVLSPLPPVSQHQPTLSPRDGNIESLHNYPQNQSYIPSTAYTTDGSRYTEPTGPQQFETSAPPPNTMTAAERKRARARIPSYTPSRFIMHTDLEDGPVGEDGLVELPPQYSDRRPGQNLHSYSNPATPSHSTAALHLHSQDPNAEDGRHLPPQR